MVYGIGQHGLCCLSAPGQAGRPSQLSVWVVVLSWHVVVLHWSGLWGLHQAAQDSAECRLTEPTA